MSTCLALGSTLLRWHDESRLGGIAPDRCAALKLVCCEAQHEPLLGLRRCFGQLACGDPPPAWLEVGVLRDAV